ncbi:MAG: MFS transporter [Thermoleophilaceae bacterium]
MRQAIDLLRGEPRVRRFFIAHTQSSLGTGAAYVALILLAYERFHSPWAITLILLADFLPSMLLGPLLGAAADRWSRRQCAVVADLVRAGSFAGLAFVHSVAATLALALLAGAGTALFRPAVLASLPGMVGRERLPAATSLFGAINDLGNTLGPALAAGALVIIGPGALMGLNGATFAVSALLLASLDFGAAPQRAGGGTEAPASLVADARAGLRATARMPGVRALLLGSGATVLCIGTVNVGEMLLARDVFHAGGAGYSALVTVSGLGIVAGSMLAAGGTSAAGMKRRYLAGLLSMAGAMAAAGAAPAFGLALAAFMATGLANGVAMVYDSLLIQTTVEDRLLGRVLGVKGMVISGSFTLAFACGGAALSLLGPRALFIASGVALAGVWAASSIALRGAWDERQPAEPRVPAGASLPAAG